jgi:hypothetical protein
MYSFVYICLYLQVSTTTTTTTTTNTTNVIPKHRKSWKFYGSKPLLSKFIDMFQFWLRSDKINRHLSWRATWMFAIILQINLNIVLERKYVPCAGGEGGEWRN